MAPRADARRFALAVMLIWLAAALLMVLLARGRIAAGTYLDADDQLRLVELRDWLGGQTFRDVSQHRLNPPFGAPMHWSRLVDLPLAALVLALRPLLGAARAELWATVLVPLATLFLAMLAIGLIARRLAGARVGLLAVALVPLCPPGLAQFLPLRIDHHGWEIVFSLAAIAAALAPPSRRSALAAALALAIGLQISLESLPMAVAILGVAGLGWAWSGRRAEGRWLASTLATLALGEALLFLGLHAPGTREGACDAISPPQLAALGVAAAGVIGLAAAAPARRVARLAGLGLVALAAGLAFHALPPRCGADAFAALEPIVRHRWYEGVKEGMPIWHAGGAVALGVILYPLIGLGCALAGWRSAAGPARALWMRYAALLAAATLVAVLVLRASALANLLVVPAAAWAMARLMARAAAHRRALVRVAGAAAAGLALAPPILSGLGAGLLAAPPADPAGRAAGEACRSASSLAALNRLAPARFLLPFDLAPTLLMATHHSALASGHHRNHAAMAESIRAFEGSDATARTVLRRHGLTYVLLCPTYVETRDSIVAAPHGFAAHLVAGRIPPWLAPVPIPGARFGLWRVTDQGPAGLPSSRSAGGMVPARAQSARSAGFSPSSSVG
ncbi:hypothetical protein [Sphingomonas morindae]|uniref:AcrB/AcrD/AcrF family protein n=1 Tax=Sphingomonas morindae TaxID=1541170 RepID=A0ABY4X8S7_9SPHN|nr:hypothetical protein [Sphingomonas morindae]USI73279.1 hypothetical protein LHA26_02015 [Sphingomonas morindae]